MCDLMRKRLAIRCRQPVSGGPASAQDFHDSNLLSRCHARFGSLAHSLSLRPPRLCRGLPVRAIDLVALLPHPAGFRLCRGLAVRSSHQRACSRTLSEWLILFSLGG